MAAMTITTEQHPTYLKAIAVGEWNMDEIFQLIASLKEGADRAHLRRLLVDVQGLEGSPSWADRASAGKRIALVLKDYKLAVVARAEIIDHSTEIVAVNRGATMVVVPSEEEALEWLGKH